MRKTFIFLLLLASVYATAAETLTNVYGRKHLTLNGTWSAIVDPYEQGYRMELYKNRKAQGKTDFYEYSFDGGLQLKVPGDWNHQSPKLDYYEGTVWYARHFNMTRKADRRYILHFGAVSYRCKVYVNGMEVARHEGSFTPFQADITDNIVDGDNFLCVAVSNSRSVDAIPALSYDWWNYGGITRDVMILDVPNNHIVSYKLTLDTKNDAQMNFSARMSQVVAKQGVTLKIPELKIKIGLQTDADGNVSCSIRSKKIKKWSPENPKLYAVEIINNDGDTVRDEIGFRTIAVKGEDILLNGKSVFLRSVSFHEEVAAERRRACTQVDAEGLIKEVLALGANMVRLAHYSQNEHIVKAAERSGIIIWEEIPVWQSIDFTNKETLSKASTMLDEMISRDVNRCSICFWGISNETKMSEARNDFLRSLLRQGRATDSTRLFTSAFDLAYYNDDKKKFVLDDPFIYEFDVVAVNKYMGWYAPWPCDPANIPWDVARGKPLIMSEFGGEALKGRFGYSDVASSWSEDYQEQLYMDNLRMFENIPNLRGVSPWVLFDFRSPFRFLPSLQDGWNRKGLLSDKGERKKAWHVMHDYYERMKNESK